MGGRACGWLIHRPTGGDIFLMLPAATSCGAVYLQARERVRILMETVGPIPLNLVFFCLPRTCVQQCMWLEPPLVIFQPKLSCWLEPKRASANRNPVKMNAAPHSISHLSTCQNTTLPIKPTPFMTPHVTPPLGRKTKEWRTQITPEGLVATPKNEF